MVVEALDRPSRDQEHIARFYKQLSFAGVRILTLADGLIDELHVGLKGPMNALFLKDLAAKTRHVCKSASRPGIQPVGSHSATKLFRKWQRMGHRSKAAPDASMPNGRWQPVAPEGPVFQQASIRRSAIESLLLDGLRHQLMAPELVAEFTAAYHAEVNRQRSGRDAVRGRQQHELAAIERRIAALVDSIAEGLDSPAIRARLAEMELRKAALTAELAAPPPTPVRLHPNLAELYRQKVADLHLALTDPLIGPEAREVLRSLIERIVVRPLPEGGFELEIVGAIAAMMGLGQSAADNKKAAHGAAVSAVDECSAKVVAGAGFEPTTFRL